jgi:uncharacterized membrane protein YdjX (TVP38/TMEM64 family)
VAWRVVVAVVPIAVLVAVVHSMGLVDAVDVESIRRTLEGAGYGRIPLFIAIYGIGILAHVPGSVFVGCGVLVFGPVWGLCWCYLGALAGNLLSFGIVRWTGYRPLDRLSWPRVDGLLAGLLTRLAARPTWAVTAIRTVFPTTAPVNYALALTEVPFSAYLIGSLVGVLPQLLASVWLFAFVFE